MNENADVLKQAADTVKRAIPFPARREARAQRDEAAYFTEISPPLRLSDGCDSFVCGICSVRAGIGVAGEWLLAGCRRTNIVPHCAACADWLHGALQCFVFL